MDKPIGAYMKEFEKLGVEILQDGEGFIVISVPPRAPNGMISEELASYFSRTLNNYVTNGRRDSGVIQVQHKVRQAGQSSSRADC